MCGSMQHGANVPILEFTVLEGFCIACGCARCIIFVRLIEVINAQYQLWRRDASTCVMCVAGDLHALHLNMAIGS